MTTKTNLFSVKCVQHVFVVISFIGLVIVSTGCAKGGQFPSVDGEDSNQSSAVDLPSEDPDSEAGVPSVENPAYALKPLVWESGSYPERKKWSAYLQQILLNQWSSLLAGSDDITNFCPKYHVLSNDERANVWAQLFAAISKYESAYSPVSRMQETTMGTDPVTEQAVYSEGLLQLSYQDVQWARWCEFNWQVDKGLSPTSPKKTILDPYKNLNCGVGIMALQIKNKGAIVLNSGVYWAVLKGNGKYQKVAEIQSIVKSLSLCK